MSDLITTKTIGANTYKGVEFTGTGERVAALDIGSDWNNLRFQFNMVVYGPQSAPSPDPVFFIGLCATGKPRSSSSAHAVGMTTDWTGGGSWSLDASSGNQAWSGSMGFEKKVGATITAASAWSNKVARGNDATMIQSWSYKFGKGSPNWSVDFVNYGSFNPTSLTSKPSDWYRAIMCNRLVSQHRNQVIGLAGSTIANTVFGSVTSIDEATNGYLTNLNIYWSIPASFSVFLSDLHLINY